MHKLDKEADEAHDEEPHAGGRGDLGELLAVGLCAYVDEHLRLLGELPERVNDVFGDRILARSHDDDAILSGDYVTGLIVGTASPVSAAALPDSQPCRTLGSRVPPSTLLY